MQMAMGEFSAYSSLQTDNNREIYL